ncbi:MAG: RDD family protein [Tannerella sp.]|jgi:uncharacterized RDD family membrane protein YckC|nr:RDD family protein [Tannerella sp.]
MADSTIITGQYVQIDQTTANVGDRILARIVDYVIITVYYVILYFVFGVGTGALNIGNDDVWIVGIFIMSMPPMFYSLLCELFNKGQTPGKQLLGIRVVMKDGSRPKLSAYLLRWLFLMVDIYLFQWIGIVSIVVTKNNQRLGDLVAGTLVIKEKDFRKINVTLDEFRHLSVSYIPVFPQAENLSLEQINLINDTLFRYTPERPMRIRDLGIKVRDFLRINPPISDESLLQTLMRDYQYYGLEAI